jgi:hypothetical protein
MTGIERHNKEEELSELIQRMKIRNQRGGVGCGYGMSRMSKEMARLMRELGMEM